MLGLQNSLLNWRKLLGFVAHQLQMPVLGSSLISLVFFRKKKIPVSGIDPDLDWREVPPRGEQNYLDLGFAQELLL